MSGLDNAAASLPPNRLFTVFSQRVELDVDFRTRSLLGRTEILVLPQSKELKTIRLNCRQASITSVTVEGKVANYTYDDPYEYLIPHDSHGVHQHYLLKQKLEPHLRNPPEEELIILLPRGVLIQALDPLAVGAHEAFKLAQAAGETSATAETPATASFDSGAGFTPLKISISFETTDIRDGLRFVGWDDGDGRYAHVYTQNSPYPGTACSLFPCVDDLTSRCLWEISIKCPRTLGDAFAKPHSSDTGDDTEAEPNPDLADDIELTDLEKTLELAVVSSGVMTDEVKWIG